MGSVLLSAFGLFLALLTPAYAEIRIGVAVPLTGRMAPVGLAIERAVTAAVADVNAQGGVLGQRVVIEVADDGCAPATAEGAANRLIAQGPVLVIGHPCSNAAAAAAALYGKANALLMVIGVRHPDVTRANGAAPIPVLRFAGRDDRQGAAAASWLLANAPGRQVAIVHDRTQYARGLVEDTVAALAQAGVAPRVLLPLVAGKPDYEDAARALRESGAEAIFFAGYPDEAVILMWGLARLGSVAPLLGSDSLVTGSFAETAGTAKARVEVLVPTAVTGRTILDLGDGERAGIEARGAFEAWMEGARMTGSIAANAVSVALRGEPIATRALGNIRFDANGDLETPSFAAAVARGGRWVIEDR
ncbi:branched-chain amino acid ABC transporter substrate-binding protein [Hyphomicrobium sp. CS1GBMeth3]|uniref:branched-chain amino acid ABC transporter substrate-binding protein n=1 Tax=Hyphomicrobium sp. CS1GBMeth3 TaxID=1892845 RepID=UPI000931CB59|nr:branched-chain amino acid ABC transporter substrate-binding protein [Hyphomicrobium sp. CS1GBMeth3]